MTIKRVGIVGAGTMGCQMAELFISHAFDVTLCSRKNDAKQHCKTIFKNNQLVASLKTVNDISQLENMDLLIESVKEDAQLKQEVFKKLETVAAHDTIIASNSSTIPLHIIAKYSTKKQNIIGFHVSNPATKMKVVEMPMLKETSTETQKQILACARQLGKEPIQVQDVPGFLFNRIMFAMLNEAANVVHAGIATKEDVDKSMMITANHPLGPIQIIDLVGIDVTVDILQSLHQQLGDDKYKPSSILLELKQKGKLGRKTKEGFYQY